MSGWIKLFRSLDQWEWYKDTNVKVIFIHLLLRANFEDKNWKGLLIKRGQLVTSREQLASETGLTIQATRTALNKLKSTSEITIKTTNKFTIITVEKYSLFQDSDEEVTSTLTSNLTNQQPTNNQQITTTKEYKNIRTKEEKNNTPKKSYRFEGMIVRLTESDYHKLKNQYTAVPDFDMELTTIDQALIEKPTKQWYPVMLAKLNYRHQLFVSQKNKSTKEKEKSIDQRWKEQLEQEAQNAIHGY